MQGERDRQLVCSALDSIETEDHRALVTYLAKELETSEQFKKVEARLRLRAFVHVRERENDERKRNGTKH